MGYLERTELLVGKNNIEKLKNSNVIVFGVGGVGGYCIEMLARCGVGKLTIVDYDTISESNINRQIIANHNNVGLSKVEEWEKRILEINPNCVVKALNMRYSKETSGSILNKHYDFVIDAIDSVSDKFNLIMECKNLKLNIISSMGAGNRICLPNYEISDIYKTENDGLARVIRKKCRENNIAELTVAYTKSKPLENSGENVGSMAYHPSSCGILIASYVINKLIGE